MASVELPIFPLPLVLFPGTPQLLHVFEPRYRHMLDDCLAADRRFGLTWVEPGAEPDPAPPPGAVGCTAYVQARSPLPDGRSNVLTLGEERYAIRRYTDAGKPYRTAVVDTFDDAPDPAGAPGELCRQVSHGFRRFAVAFNALNDAGMELPELAADPKTLSFQVAAGLEVDARVKQELLVLRSTRGRLEALAQLLRRVIGELGPRAEAHVRARRNGTGGPGPALARGA